MAVDMDTSRIRDQIPALKESNYFNTGGTGPCSRDVTDAWIDLERFIQSVGPDAPSARERVSAVEAAARNELALALGADANELAITRNIAEGINTVAWGMEWSPGDEVLLTDQEHPTGQMPWLSVADRWGVVIRRVKAVGDPIAMIENLRASIGPRTRLVAFSHVTCEDGIRLPARAIVEAAHAAGIPVLFDGAQAVGQFPIDLHEIGCDFYATTGLKWVCAGRGVGAFYIRRDRLAALRVSWSGAYASSDFNMSTGAYTFRDDARRFEFGGRNWQMYASYAQALANVRAIGIETIETIVREKASRLKRMLAVIEGCRVLTPMEPARSTGIVTFELNRLSGTETVDQVWLRRKIICRAAFQGRAVRLSVAHFTSAEEITRVVETVRELSRGT